MITFASDARAQMLVATLPDVPEQLKSEKQEQRKLVRRYPYHADAGYLARASGVGYRARATI
jgi:hypothetical protein